MASRTLITGLGGFAGSHLAERLLEAGDTVEGTCSPRGDLAHIRHLQDRVVVHRCDLRSSRATSEVVRKARPDVVYHLAAVTFVPEGETDPGNLFETNFLGTLHLLEAVRREAPQALFVFISSSEVYGGVGPEESPITEEHPARPVHAYGLSKLVAEQLVEMYGKTRGVSALRLRPFNHIGPRQSDRFVCSSFARQIARIESGRQEPVVRAGDLTPIRDFTDVRDMVRGYRLAAERCMPGALYQIASGTGVPIGRVLEELLPYAGVPVEVRPDTSRLRKVDIPVLVGDPGKFIAATGWRPRFRLSETLRDLYRFWKARIAQEEA
ncbi:MAG: GDP-mannose 4,6-dehydratase [bacterium]